MQTAVLRREGTTASQTKVRQLNSAGVGFGVYFPLLFFSHCALNYKYLAEQQPCASLGSGCSSLLHCAAWSRSQRAAQPLLCLFFVIRSANVCAHLSAFHVCCSFFFPFLFSFPSSLRVTRFGSLSCWYELDCRVVPDCCFSDSGGCLFFSFIFFVVVLIYLFCWPEYKRLNSLENFILYLLPR